MKKLSGAKAMFGEDYSQAYNASATHVVCFLRKKNACRSLIAPNFRRNLMLVLFMVSLKQNHVVKLNQL